MSSRRVVVQPRRRSCPSRKNVFGSVKGERATGAMDASVATTTQWRSVFSWNTDRLPGAQADTRQQSGSVVSIMDPYHTRVLVETSTGNVEVHVPYCDRFDGFADLVLYCVDVCRVGVVVCGNCVTRYQCLVLPGAFARMLEGAPNPMLEHVLKVFRHWSKFTRLPTEPALFEPHEAIDVPATWNGIELFRSQEESLRWMKDLERRVLAGAADFEAAHALAVPGTDWSFDVAASLFFRRDDARSSSVRLQLRGGILADATGGGKTATLLRLLCDTRANRDAVPAACGARARGTLVVVPSNLQFQWTEEVAKFTRGLTMITLGEKSRHSLLELQSADIVLTTTQYLRSSSYVNACLELFRSLDLRLREPREAMRDAGVMAHVADHLVRGDTCAHPAVVELLAWPRVVLDEVHEYFNASVSARERLRLLHALRVDVCWGVSGTPHGSSDHLQRMTEAFTCRSVTSAFNASVLRLFEETAIRGHAFTWTALRHVVHHVDMSAHEQLVLLANENMPLEGRAHICAGICVESCDESCTIAAQCARLLTEYDSTVNKLRERLHLANTAAGNSQLSLESDERRLSDIASLDSDETRSRTDAIRVSLRQHHKNIATAHAACRRTQEQLDETLGKKAFLERRLELLAGEEHTCTICATRRCDVITSCGHLFCGECIQRNRELRAECPLCRAEYHTVKSVSARGGQCLPSKWEAVRQLLETLTGQGERVVLCVQWRRLYRVMRRFLEARFTSFALEGSVCRRAAELQRFAATPASVLVLCFEDSIAGLNLTCSNQLVLCNPICADVDTAKNIESQAIGRLARVGQLREVQVHHFVGTDSCEEALWAAQHSENFVYCHNGPGVAASVVAS